MCDWMEKKNVKDHFYRLCGMEPADWSFTIERGRVG